ncbi:MAG: hypothetical protein IPO04_19575 [Cytophagaceae bacterium]|nr:hypothetical protein [Cytophagaceae bacterium]
MRSRLALAVLLLFILLAEKPMDPATLKAFGDKTRLFLGLPEDQVRNLTINLGQANWDKIQRDWESNCPESLEAQRLFPVRCLTC